MTNMTPLERFGAELRKLHTDAGSPILRQVVHQAAQAKPHSVKFAIQSLSGWLNGKSAPRNERVMRFLIHYLGELAQSRGHTVHPWNWWKVLYDQARQAGEANRGGRPAGVPSRRDAATINELDPPSANFVNRAEEIAELRRLLARSTGTGSRTVVVLSGPGGVGKTALAVQWAYEVRARYPDGVFCRNLTGYGPGVGDEPAEPSDVLADWLWSLCRLKSDELPKSSEGRRRLFNANMVGRRMMMVLDNAASADQVRPLLPAGDSCLVLVTSRNQMRGLLDQGAYGVRVEPLSPDSAVDLLRVRVGDRVDADPLAAAALAGHCAGLPQALHTAATHLCNDLEQSVATQAELLSDARHRLIRLGHPDDSETSVTAAHSLSYQRLSPAAQRLFRLMAVHPASGATAGLYSIARLAGRDLADTEQLLAELERESLISRARGRYRSPHDLLLLYAKELLDQQQYETERRQALDRLAHAYYGCVNHAFDRVNEGNPMIDAGFLTAWRRDDPEGVRRVDDMDTPAAWFSSERLNVVALVRTLGSNSPLPITAKLACSLFYFLEAGGYLRDWEDVEQIAADFAEAHGDRLDKARSLRNRARIVLVKILNAKEQRHTVAGGQLMPDAYDDAVAMLERSRRLYHEVHTGDGLAGEATTIRELADLRRLQADGSPDSIEATIGTYREAERLYEQLGNANGLASLRLALGMTYTLDDWSDDLAQAERLFIASLAYASELNDRGAPRHPRLMGYAQRRLGDLHRRKGELSKAVVFYRDAVATFSASDDVISAGSTLVQQGITLAEVAVEAREQARAALLEAQSLMSALPGEAANIDSLLNGLNLAPDDADDEG
jgi:tetratricopeptide (TPR) repeat protein